MAGNFVDSLVIGIGLDTSQIAQGVKEVGAQLDSGLKSAVENAVKGASPLGKALGDFGKDAEERALKALNGLGIRSAEQIQQKIAELQGALDKINSSSTLTARDKQAAIDEITKRIETLKLELEKGIPQAAAEGFAGAEAAAGKFKGFMSSLWAQISGPLLGAFATGNAISSYISNSVAAGELADKLKVDIEEIQIWSGAMDRAGGSATSLQSTIEKLNASGKAQGDAIGVLLDLADKADTMSKEAFVQKAKELEVDEKTIEVLAQGRKALDEHLKRQKELGAYTKEDAENSKKFKQSLADLLQVWDSFTSFIGRLAIPAMKWLADILTDVVIFLRQHTPFVVAAIGLVGAALAYRLMPPLRELPKLIAGISRAFMRWFPIIAVIAGIALVIDDLYAYLKGGKSQFAEFWSIFGTGPEIMQKLQTAWKELKQWGKDVFNGLIADVKALWNILEDTGAVDGFKAALLGLGHLIHGIFTDSHKEAEQGAEQMLTGIWNMISGVVGRMLSAVGDMFSDMWTEATEGAAEGFSRLGTEIWNWITGIVDQIKAYIREKVSGMLDGIKLPSFGDLFGGAGDVAGSATDMVKGGLGKVGDFFGDMFKGAEPETAKAGAKVEDGMAKAASTVKQGFDAAWSATRDFAVTQFQGAAVTIQGIFAGIVSGIETQVGNLVMGAQRMMQPGMVPAAAGVRAQQAGGRGPTINQQNRVNVYAPGGDPAVVQRGVERGLNPGRTARAAASGTVQK